MRRQWAIHVFLILICFPVCSHAQLWSGILKPTYGSGACGFGQIASVGQCAIDWTQVGIPGGIPTNWTQSGSTIDSTGSDQTSAIQSAINSCAGSSLPGKYVQLGGTTASPQTFVIAGNIQIRNYCMLVGGGPQATILQCKASSGSCVHAGTLGDAPYKNGSIQITSGNTAGSSSVTLNSTALDGSSTNLGLSVGGYLVISELNNPVIVSANSPQNSGACTYCDVIWSGTRLREQIVQVTSISGSGPYAVAISPVLYTDYGTASGTSPAYATPFGVENGGPPDCIYCGIENLQLASYGYGISSGMSPMDFTECAYCWVYRVMVNYTDADWLDTQWCYRCEIRDNYFFNAFGHGAGGTDNDVNLRAETTATLVVNNIFERGHSNVIVDWGAAGNVVAYNYSTGSVDAVGAGANQYDFVEHGPYPEYNLWEGNIGPNWQPDSWHGNEGYDTAFRNWWRGSNTVAPYQAEQISSGTCSGGTCTINWTSGSSNFYAGTYIELWGTNQVECGNGSSIMASLFVWGLTGTAGTKSSTFSAGSCTSWTGGWATTVDLASYPVPITHLPLDWTTNTYNTYQTMWGVTIPAFAVGENLIGNVIGSSQQIATAGTLYNSGSGACTSCLRTPTSRSYNPPGNGYAITWDYDTSSDGDGSVWSSFSGGPSDTAGYWSTQGFATAFYNQNYDAASGATITISGGSPALPGSFFLSSKPSWWVDGIGGTNPPWPGIGPDVSGGPDSAVGSHANYNPAELCYNNTSRDSTGAKQFNPAACYTDPSQLTPPTGLNAVVQ